MTASFSPTNSVRLAIFCMVHFYMGHESKYTRQANLAEYNVFLCDYKYLRAYMGALRREHAVFRVYSVSAVHAPTSSSYLLTIQPGASSGICSLILSCIRAKTLAERLSSTIGNVSVVMSRS